MGKVDGPEIIALSVSPVRLGLSWGPSCWPIITSFTYLSICVRFVIYNCQWMAHLCLVFLSRGKSIRSNPTFCECLFFSMEMLSFKTFFFHIACSSLHVDIHLHAINHFKECVKIIPYIISITSNTTWVKLPWPLNFSTTFISIIYWSVIK